MDLFRATKTHGEREDEEADRLVRPSPKVKPPRRDLRREHTDTEQDPDLKADQTVEGDPDLSLNRKKTAVRVLERYLTGKSRDERVPAWNKKEKRRVLVSPATLKDRRDLYEPYKDQDDDDDSEPLAQPKPREPLPNPLAEDLEEDRPVLPKTPKLRGKALLHAIDPDNDERPESYQVGLAQDFAKALADAKDPTKELTSWRLEDMGYTTNQEVAQALRAVGYQPRKPKVPEAKPAPKPEAPPAEPVKQPEAPVAAPKPEAKPEAPPEASKPQEPPAEAPAAKPEVPDLEVPKSKEPEAPKTEADPEAKPEEAPEAPAEPEPKPETPEDKTEAIAEVAQSAEPEPEESAPKVDIPTLPDIDVEDVTHETPEFQAFARGSKGVKVTKDGKLLFTDISDRGLSTGKKTKTKAVPFEDLPEEAQQAWKERFNEEGAKERRIGLVRMMSAQDPATRRILQDIANPFSDLGKTIREQRDLSGVLATDAVPGLQGKLPDGLDDLADLVAAAEVVHKPPPPPARRAITPEESEEAFQMMMDELPPHLWGTVPSDAHPDDVRALVKAVKNYIDHPPGPRERAHMIESVRKNGYYLDPKAIPPPETVKGKPFRSLTHAKCCCTRCDVE
jgi:hypothetical protein